MRPSSMRPSGLSVGVPRGQHGVADLMRGRRHSVAGLRAALDEAQLRSMRNQKVLREAGERGQKLLCEEVALRRRLEECRSELRVGYSNAGFDEDDADDGVSMHTSGGSVASNSSISSHVLLATPTSRRGGFRPRAVVQAEKQRLLEQNMVLAEELEEQERDLVSMEDEPNTVNARSADLADEISEAHAKAAEADRQRAKEHDTLLLELSEVEGLACGMLGALERQLEGAQARHATLKAELQSERSLRDEYTANHHEVMERLQVELDDFRCKSEAAEAELLHLEQRISAQEVGQAEEAMDSEQAWGEVPMMPTASELLGSEWRSAADALPEDPLGISHRKNSISSMASESWDGLSVSDVASLPGSRQNTRMERRRHRAQASHFYRDLEGPVTVKTCEDVSDSGASSFWKKSLVGALWS